MNQIYISLIADLTEFFRIKMAVLSSCITPVVMILSFGLGVGKEQFLFVAPGILALGTMFSCTYTVGYTVIMDRQRRLINDIVLSPISYSSFVISRVLGGIVKCFIQLLITVLITVIFFKLPLSHPLLLIIGFIQSAILFGGIGMILASWTNAMSFPGIANLLMIPFMFFCGVFFPITNFAKGVLLIVKFIPFTASVEIFRYSITGRFLSENLTFNIVLLAVHSFIAVFLGIIIFKRSVVH